MRLESANPEGDHDATSEIQMWSQKCMTGFMNLSLGLENVGGHPHIARSDFERIFARFKIWAGNLGALQTGASSLDARLRDSVVIRSSMLRLLSRLCSEVNQIWEVITGTRKPLEEQLLRSSDGDSSGESSDEEEIFEVVQRHEALIGIMSDLYKISFKLRNTTSRTVSSRALTHKEVDKDSGVDVFHAVAEFDRRHVYEHLLMLRRDVSGTVKTGEQESSDKTVRSSQEISTSREDQGPDEWPMLNEILVQFLAQGSMQLFPGTSADFLAYRLANANTNRRKYFAYWRRHSLKLAKGPNAFQMVPQQPTLVPGVLDIKPSENMEPEIDKDAGLLRAPRLSAPGPLSILSGTEATGFNQKIEERLETETVVSYATTSHGLDGEAIELPPPPSDASSKDEFICPYCHVVCPSHQGRGKAWRSHVLHDMQPYICTYHPCPTSDQLFANKNTWLEHERLVHRRIWQCHEHPSFVSASKEAFQIHLQNAHVNLTTAQAQQLANFAEASTRDERDQCPFCLSSGPFPEGLHSHMAYHQERIASFALPRYTNMTDEDTSRSGQAQGRRSMDSLHSGSDITDEEYDEEKLEDREAYLVRALRSYAARRDNELGFAEGQVILVFGGTQKWLKGYYLTDLQVRKGIEGVFPASFVEFYSGPWSLRMGVQFSKLY